MHFSKEGAKRLPPGRLDMTSWSFHKRPNLPIYAGEWATPRLRIELADGQVAISWTSREEGFQLESASQVVDAEWSSVSSVVRDGDNYQVTLPLAPGQRFFRLRK